MLGIWNPTNLTAQRTHLSKGPWIVRQGWCEAWCFFKLCSEFSQLHNKGLPITTKTAGTMSRSGSIDVFVWKRTTSNHTIQTIQIIMFPYIFLHVPICSPFFNGPKHLGLYPPRLREPTVEPTRFVWCFFPARPVAQVSARRARVGPGDALKGGVTKKGCRKVGELNDHLLFVVGWSWWTLYMEPKLVYNPMKTSLIYLP